MLRERRRIVKTAGVGEEQQKSGVFEAKAGAASWVSELGNPKTKVHKANLGHPPRFSGPSRE